MRGGGVATVFNALQFHGVKSTDRVGIIGVGGPGHLAIQFAAAMGCEVVVFSGTHNKKEEAMKLGAREFYATNGVQELRVRSIHHLLVTTSEQPDWPRYLPMMVLSGTIYPLSVSQGDLKVPYIPILSSGLKIQDSLVAAREIHREMLEFAAIHNIKPVIEKFPMNVAGVEEAFKKLEGAMRYRGVLVA
jgi:D-arabinose 1-dehydrogenase-like Zn-dependent alcohol dehydrogenase